MNELEDPVRRLGRLDCCAVSDAMDKLGLVDRVATGLPRQSSDRTVVGRAVTVKLVPAAQAPVPQPGSAPRHLGTTAIEAAQAGEVIVVEQRTGIDAGSWGGILTLGAKMRGVAGVVADGPVRDLDEARNYDFPIFCRAGTARTARGRVAELATNVPVQIGPVAVQPGDFVIADGSGVAFVPAAAIEQVLEVAEGIAAREAGMARDLLAGRPITQVMGAAYEHMLK